MLLLVLAACQQRITPPAETPDSTFVHVTDHGRHAGLVLPAADGTLTEWFWGDWHYFALRERSLWSGLRALFASPASTLGRRTVTAGIDLRRATGAASVLSIRVDRKRAARLNTALTLRHDSRHATEVRHPDQARFVIDDARYGLFSNSNHKVCEWLVTLGAEVRCHALGARFRLVARPAA